MDGSSYEDDHMKSTKWTDTKESPQDGRIQKNVRKTDGSSYRDDHMKSTRWTDTKESPQDGRSSYKDDQIVHKMDGYKRKSARRTDHLTRMST